MAVLHWERQGHVDFLGTWRMQLEERHRAMSHCLAALSHMMKCRWSSAMQAWIVHVHLVQQCQQQEEKSVAHWAEHSTRQRFMLWQSAWKERCILQIGMRSWSERHLCEALLLWGTIIASTEFAYVRMKNTLHMLTKEISQSQRQQVARLCRLLTGAVQILFGDPLINSTEVAAVSAGLCSPHIFGLNSRGI